LNAEGIIPRNMAGYGLADCIRFTIAGPVEMANTFGLLETWYRNYRIGGSI